MKMRYWKEFHEAMKAYHTTKGDIFRMAYRGDYSGIDFAIPQNLYDAIPTDEGRFYAVTDCSGPYYRVVDMRDLIPDEIAEKAIKLNGMQQAWIKRQAAGEKLDADTYRIYSELYDEVFYPKK